MRRDTEWHYQIRCLERQIHETTLAALTNVKESLERAMTEMLRNLLESN
jgi:hypothetical protein